MEPLIESTFDRLECVSLSLAQSDDLIVSVFGDASPRMLNSMAETQYKELVSIASPSEDY